MTGLSGYFAVHPVLSSGHGPEITDPVIGVVPVYVVYIQGTGVSTGVHLPKNPGYSVLSPVYADKPPALFTGRPRYSLRLWLTRN